MKKDSLTAHFPWQLFWDKIAKDKVIAQRSQTVQSRCGGIAVLQMKMSHRQTAGPTGLLRKEEDKASGHSEGHSCKTSDCSPSTGPTAQSDTLFLKKKLPAHAHCWLYPHRCLSLLSVSELISFLFNLAATAPMSPFCLGGPEAVPVEHGIAAVHHSCQQCLLPGIYIISTPASMSTGKVTERGGHIWHKC